MPAHALPTAPHHTRWLQPRCSQQRGPSLDLVVSVYNESAALPKFHAAARTTVDDLAADGVTAQIVYVNDGSSDDSGTILDRFAEEPGVEVLHFSRNFGHEAAMLAGLDASASDYAIFLDADLQHPPAAIPDALAAARAGHDVVLMQRAESGSGWLRQSLNAAFYRSLAAISEVDMQPNASDFFLVGRPVIDLLQREMRERNRFLRGLVQWVGFRRAIVTYSAPPRVAGQSKYSFRRLVRLARDATVAFSTVPLQLTFVVAGLMFLLSLVTAAVSIAGWLFGNPPSGYTTIMIFGTFVAAAQFVLLGVIGEYIGQLLEETKGRPVYIVARTSGESRTRTCSSEPTTNANRHAHQRMAA